MPCAKQSMTRKRLLCEGIKTLQSIPTGSFDASLLLCFCLSMSKEELLIRPSAPVSIRDQKQYLSFVSLRKKGKPIPYITKQKEFFGLPFFVSPKVMIPRPETEIMVEAALDWIFSRAKKDCVVADIGCGSGNIGIAIKLRASSVHVIATDISDHPLSIAKRNAKNHNIQIRFLKGNLLEPLIKRKIFPDIICANLPYLDPNRDYDPSILHEPRRALFAPLGTSLITGLLQRIHSLHRLPSLIMLETDPRHHNRTILLKGYRQSIKKDLAGRDRFLVFMKK